MCQCALTLTWAKHNPTLISSRFHLTSPSNNPSTLNWPAKQFRHSLFSGAQPEFRLEKKKKEKLKQTEVCILSGIASCGAERAPLLRACIRNGDIWQWTLASALGVSCFLSVCFFINHSVLVVLHPLFLDHIQTMLLRAFPPVIWETGPHRPVLPDKWYNKSVRKWCHFSWL